MSDTTRVKTEFFSKRELLVERLEAIRIADRSDVYSEGFATLKLVLGNEFLLSRLNCQEKFTATLVYRQLQSYYDSVVNKGKPKSLTYDLPSLRSFLLELLHTLLVELEIKE